MHRHGYIRVSATRTTTPVFVRVAEDQRHQCVRVAVGKVLVEQRTDAVKLR
jgi:hypothetical protein